jgi:hypothetical protein
MVGAILGASACDIVNFPRFRRGLRRQKPWFARGLAGQGWGLDMSRSKRVIVAWYCSVAAVGLAFGLLGERRPFGDDVLAHPLIIFALVVAGALLVLRFAGGRPVPDIIPERALVRGCALGLAAFLVGNFVAAHLIGR